MCGGEDKIREYCENLVEAGGKRMAETLGTVVLDNKDQTLYQCCFVNVRLSIVVTKETASYDIVIASEKNQDRVVAGNDESVVHIKEVDAPPIARWMTERSVRGYDTMISIKFYAGAIWCRISGQIYLEVEDFEWAAYKLMEICEEVAKGDFDTLASS